MKPLYSDKIRLTRCPCCISKYAKAKSGSGKKLGNSAARQRSKKDLRTY